LVICTCRRPIRENNNGIDTIYWTDARSTEDGRTVLCRYAPTNPSRSIRNAVDIPLASPTSNIRSRVHEYGGGAMTFASTQASTTAVASSQESKNKEEDLLFYTEFTTQQLYRIKLTNSTSTSNSNNDDDYGYDNDNDNDNDENDDVHAYCFPDDNPGQYWYADCVYDEHQELSDLYSRRSWTGGERGTRKCGE